MSPKNGQRKLFGRFNALVLLLISLIFTSVFGGYLGHYFQNRSWSHRKEAELRETERQAATALFEEVSRLMDRRLYRMRRLLWGYQTGKSQGEMHARWDSYREVLFNWNENLNRNLALVQRYFGTAIRTKIEKEISNGFRELNNELEGLSRKREYDKERFQSLRALADSINNEIYSLDVQMIERIQRGSVGFFSPEIQNDE